MEEVAGSPQASLVLDLWLDLGRSRQLSRGSPAPVSLSHSHASSDKAGPVVESTERLVSTETSETEKNQETEK